ncbi:MAG: zinc ribbon domain-containing protein [Oscillospiraceae bacterium]|nr:zinc ribbon domain-containing protein [Oscillospiraceae bacterium]
MNCPNCGRELDEGMKFCPECGTGLAAAFQAAPVETPEGNEAAEMEEAAAEPVEAAAEETVGNFVRPAPIESPAALAPVIDEPAAAEEPETLQADKRSGKKGLLIGLGCLILAAVVGLGVWLLTRSREPALEQAAQNSLAELRAYVEDLPNLNAIVTNVEKLGKGQGLHTELSFTQEQLADGEKLGEMKAVSNGDLSRSAVRFSGRLAYDDQELEFSAYADAEQLQLAAPKFLGEQETVSLPLKDLTKQWNESALSELLGVTMPQEVEELFSGLEKLKNAEDAEAALERLYGQDWTQLRDSFRSEKYEGTPHFEGKGVTYTLKWDREALKRIYEKVGDEPMESVEIESIQDLGKLSELSANLYMSLLGRLSEEIEDPQLYVEGGRLIGLYLEGRAPEEKESWAELRLAGEGNIWERVLFIVNDQKSDGSSVLKTTEIRLKKEDGCLLLEVEELEQDSSDPYQYEGKPFSLRYSDADGALTISAWGEPAEELPKLFLLPDGDGVRIKAETEEEFDYGYSAVIRADLQLHELNAAVEPLSRTPTELLKLSEEEAMELLQRINEQVTSFMTGE